MRVALLLLVWTLSTFVFLVDAQPSVNSQISAELLRVTPGNPGSGAALVTWTAFDNSLEGEGGTTRVEAYELQYSESRSGDWKSLGDSLTGLLLDPKDKATEPVPKQRVFTRADDGETISDGYFRLMLSFEGSSPSILGGRATAGVVTPPITFDASAATMKAAIESLEQIITVQVFRNALGQGAFEWIILFDVVAYDGQDPLPLLSLYTETVSALWTGDGDQVAAQYLRTTPSSPGLHRRICSSECKYEVAELHTGRTFAFRVRARFSLGIGWGSWSSSSEPLEIPATRLPRAPSSPELLAATSSHFTITWRMRRERTQESGVFVTELFPAVSFHAQQQCDNDVGWTTISERIAAGFSGNSDIFSTGTASLRRPPGSTCIFRVSARNANGQGPFSLPSAPFTTLQTAPGPVLSIRVLRDPLTVTWETPTDLGGHAAQDLTYDVEYRAGRSSTWTRVSPELIDTSKRTASISKVPLKGYTTYVVRVRAMAEKDQVGTFSQSQKFLTDYTVEEEPKSDKDSLLGAQQPLEARQSLLGAQQPFEARQSLLGARQPLLGAKQVVIAATRQTSANRNDWYYVQQTGNGGRGGSAVSEVQAQPGEHGVVLIFPVTWSGERLSERSFFYTGSSQSYRVPREQEEQKYGVNLAHRIIALDVYAWGAGGAGARSSTDASSDLSNGGGGAFARGLLRVNPGDSINILVGGGGHEDGRGGFNGGGNGGTGDFSGGGGGGASEVLMNGRTVLVAAGGGGAGSTDYCCAHGGGGGDLNQAEAGLAADATTIPLDLGITGQPPRDEYHSSNVAGDTRDSEGLPARHQHLDWGFAASTADYSVLATGGTGATSTTAGLAGIGGLYQFSLEGKCLMNPQTSLMEVAVAPFEAARSPSHGQRRRGGSGQSGKQAGGGGGGGFFGGGGGGAGVDGAGGGGGSSFVSLNDLFNSSKAGSSDASLRPQATGEGVQQLSVTPLTSSSVSVTWKAPRYGFSQLVEGFLVEMANRSASEDFRIVRLITLPNAKITGNNGNITVNSLAPMAAYRFRVKPLLLDGSGSYSDVVTLRIPPKPLNTWQRCVTRTMDEEITRAGMRLTTTPPLQRLPSARRGHSLTSLDNYLYLFGGMAKSYECNQAHKVPCLLQQPRSVSNELWRYDLLTETWWSVPQPTLLPPPREKHSMAVVKNRLILFGGRQNNAADASDASTWGPQALNDLWELSISSTTAKQASVSLDSRQPANLPIPDGGEAFALGKKSPSASGEQLCVAKVVVKVQITHACPHKLQLQLFGPGPATFPGRQQTVHFPADSQARETTWSDSQGLGSFQGDHRTTGTAPNTRAFPVLLRSPEEAADRAKCIAGTQKLSFASTGVSKASFEPLSVFHQLPVAGNWTLEVADTAADGLVGTIDSWDVVFDVAPCVPGFTWTSLSSLSTGTAPSPRFQHSVVVFESSMFVFGGAAGGTGLELNDLYRLDYSPSAAFGVAPTARWTQLASLTDRESPSIAERRVHAGRTTLLTPYELMAVGRGLKPPRREPLGSSTPSTSRFELQFDVHLKHLEDVIDGWSTVTTDGVGLIDEQRPVARYWSAGTFVFSPPGNSVPRVYLFGGQDDTTLLDDLWSLNLAQLDEDFSRSRLQTQRIRTCAWRQENSAHQALWASSCGATTTAAAVSKCTLEMLMLYAWCEEYFQSIAI
ncbi:Titin [Phytophthora citrophthora]|uniref:receptor protein-tyrosine kinase n=1 Tax=Phytophthora citrophthora TaxID=4793 RepID=A0AAD9G1L3_9STRA|nr:Titin [Phytophthora citrophthora]